MPSHDKILDFESLFTFLEHFIITTVICYQNTTSRWCLSRLEPNKETWRNSNETIPKQRRWNRWINWFSWHRWMHVANEESPTRGAPNVITSTLIFFFNSFVNSAVSFAHKVAREPPSEWPVTRTSSNKSSESHLSWISVFISSQAERNCLLKPRCTWTLKTNPLL